MLLPSLKRPGSSFGGQVNTTLSTGARLGAFAEDAARVEDGAPGAGLRVPPRCNARGRQEVTYGVASAHDDGVASALDRLASAYFFFSLRFATARARPFVSVRNPSNPSNRDVRCVAVRGRPGHFASPPSLPRLRCSAVQCGAVHDAIHCKKARNRQRPLRCVLPLHSQIRFGRNPPWVSLAEILFKWDSVPTFLFAVSGDHIPETARGGRRRSGAASSVQESERAREREKVGERGRRTRTVLQAGDRAGQRGAVRSSAGTCVHPAD